MSPRTTKASKTAKAPKARTTKAKTPKARAAKVAPGAGMGSVQENIKRFGIYINDKEKKVVRINSPYWFPPEPQWKMVTNEVNATLLKIREVAKEKGLTKTPDQIQWGSIPLLD